MEKIAYGGADEVVVVTILLELREHRHWVFVSPVRELHDMVAVRVNRIATRRINDERTVQAGLLLKGSVRVVPECPCLQNLEAIGKGLTRRDAGKADPRHAVHLIGKQNAMPVYGGRPVHAIGDTYRHRIAFAPPQGRRRQGPVDRGRQARRACEIDQGFRDGEIKLRTGQDLRSSALGPARILPRPRWPDPISRAQYHATGGKTL